MDILLLVKELFFAWFGLFTSFTKDFNVLWILIPIWLSWFFTEFFQEKQGTSFGNAVTNGAVPIWVAIDWTRYLVNSLNDKAITLGVEVYAKFGLCIFVLLYGSFVIVEGLKTSAIAHVAGRIRVITYILVMFTPIVYGVVEISTINLASIFVFSPFYYFLLELIVKIIPDSKAFSVDHKKEDSIGSLSGGSDPFGSSDSSSSDPFASSDSSDSLSNDPFASDNNSDPFASNDSNPFPPLDQSSANQNTLSQQPNNAAKQQYRPPNFNNLPPNPQQQFPQSQQQTSQGQLPRNNQDPRRRRNPNSFNNY